MSVALRSNSHPAIGQRQAIWALLALNFFMADMEAGIGPYLGIFLQSHGWRSGQIGTVLMIGAFVGMALTAPAGALIDATRRKRLYVIISGLCTVAASALILYSQEFWLVTFSQVASAMAGAAIDPAIAGITLGVVLQKGFNRQTGHNQAFNHAGNVVGAIFSGYLGFRYGYPAVFLLSALFGFVTLLSVLFIPETAIDDRAARGLKETQVSDAVGGWSTLFRCKPLLILAGAMGFFQLGNAAMFPLYGMAVVSKMHDANGTWFVAMTIIVSQTIMVLASLIAVRLAEKRGYWFVLLVSFLSLPIRGYLAAHLITPWGVYPVQFLDGVGVGLQSVAVPSLVARLLNGTGRVNVGQGAIMTVRGVGAALSPLMGGWIAESLGYPSAFTLLGSMALGSLALWISFCRPLKACDRDFRAYPAAALNHWKS